MSLDAEVLAQTRERVGGRGVSAYVNELFAGSCGAMRSPISSPRCKQPTAPLTIS